MRSLRYSALALLFTALAAAAQAPPPYPVIFVHGLNSDEGTWAESVAYFEGQGWGAPYAYHFDLNASATSTAYWDDVVTFQHDDGLLAVADYWAGVAHPGTARRLPAAQDTVAVDYALPGELAPGPGVQSASPARTRTRATSARRSDAAFETRLFAVNFHTWYDADAGVIHVHKDRGASAQSESNESAITKQGAALSLVVQDVLARTGADRVILVGHSMGGLAIREYLQRRAPDGLPAWWARYDEPDGHRTAAAVTYGTPHQGSNAGVTCLSSAFAGVDCDAEAVRDLRFSYQTSGDAPAYLWGGPERVGAFFYNHDVNADGDEDDVTGGLNVGDRFSQRALDNPDHPLPLDVRYTYVTSNFSGLGDGVVDYDRQALSYDAADGNRYLGPYGGAVRQIVSDRFHLTQPSDYPRIADAIAIDYGVPAEPDPAGEAEITLWPNPARDRVTIRVPLRQPATVTVEAVDMLGRVVARRVVVSRASGGIDLSLAGVAPGAYVLRATDGRQRGWSVPFTVVR